MHRKFSWLVHPTACWLLIRSYKSPIQLYSILLPLSRMAAKKPILEAKVDYSSNDSLSFTIGEQKVYLYDKASVNYQDIALKADYIEFNYGTKTVMAAGAIDSAGHLAGKPEFTQGVEMFNSDTMRYNFDTKKAFIKLVITKQGEGYVHSTRTKRLADGEIHMSKGKYTTCDAPQSAFLHCAYQGHCHSR